MNWIAKLKELHESVDGGESRWYVNDVGVVLDGTLIYDGVGDAPYKLVPVHDYVGLVDSHNGGMIAYGSIEIMEDPCRQAQCAACNRGNDALVMFYATAGHNDGGEFYGACLVDASGFGHAQMRAVVLGVMATRIIPLPELTDQIPSTYFERFLYTKDLAEIDILLGGDGTGTITADDR